MTEPISLFNPSQTYFISWMLQKHTKICGSFQFGTHFIYNIFVTVGKNTERMTLQSRNNGFQLCDNVSKAWS